MKINSNYKMSKDTKRLLAITPVEKVSFMKKQFIGAEIAEQKAKQAKIKETKIDLEA